MSNVEHPSHYNLGKIEVIAAIEDWGFGEGFNRGNAIKRTAATARRASGGSAGLASKGCAPAGRACALRNGATAVKYIARAGRKDPDKEIEDLKKARFYIDAEIARLERGK